MDAPPFRRAFRLPWRTRRQIRDDLDDELDFYLDMRAAELAAGGLSPEEARREAVRRFGDLEYTRRYCLDLDSRSERMIRRAEWLDDLRQDTAHACRALRRSPGFAAVALVTLALGVGATTAIYTVVERTLLERLPYRDPERVVRIYQRGAPHVRGGQIAAGDFVDFRARQRSFTGLAALAPSRYSYVGGDEPHMLQGLRVSANMFDVLGARAAIGRTFAAGEDEPGAAPVIVLSHRAWRQYFGGDPRVVGRTVALSESARTVVGVMPPGFILDEPEIDVFVPLDLGPVLADVNRARKFRWLGMVGRLRPGVTVAQGEADLAGIARQLEREHPEANTGFSVAAMSIRESLVGEVRRPLLVLMGAAALVLLIACANVGSLLLSRTVARRQELGIRAALGAGRGRIARQLLTESAVLALAGSALGLVVAHWASATLTAAAAPALPPTGDAARIDARVLLVTLATAAATAMLFGLAPALAGSRLDFRGTRQHAARGSTGDRTRYRLRAALVAGQMALAVVLLVGAGLLMRSLYHLQQVELGFDPSRLLTFRIELRGAKYATPERGNQLFETLHERLSAIPGVISAASTGTLPLRGGSNASLAVRGRPVPEGQLPAVGYTSVSRDYFETMRIPVRRGRAFDARDGATTPGVVVVSESVARRHWPKSDAVGAYVRLGPDPSEPWAEVIGVVGDVRHRGAAADARPTVYVLTLQDHWSGRHVIVRTAAEPDAVAAAARALVRQLDPNLPVIELRTMEEVAEQSLAGRRLPMMLMTVFAGLALVLAAVGVYGVMSYGVAARTREFGIRMALGAPRRAVLRLVVRQGLATALGGLALGLAGAALATRLLSGLLFGVTPLDPATFAAVAALLLAVALGASWLPARRATRVDPISALRAE